MDAASTHRQTTCRPERDEQGVWTLHLDRPAASLNALGSRFLHELDAALSQIEADPKATEVIIRSAKPRGFCAGADLNELHAAGSPAEVEAFARLGIRVFSRLSALAIPTTALIHGDCLGGGLELALACRQRVGFSDDVELRIGTPEIRLGLVPGWGAISLLPRLIGLQLALKLLLSGEPVNGSEAVEIGLIDTLIEPVEDFADPKDSSRKAVSWPPTNVAAEHARQRLLDVLAVDIESGLEAGLEAAAQALGETVFSPEGQAALTAFVQKHPPR